MRSPALDPIADEGTLRELLGEPAGVVRAKVADHLSELTRQFVDRSPFVLLATSAPDGTCDVSPRGDPPGFVRVLDQVFMHCSKAFLRAQLWDPGRYVDGRDLPSAGAIHRSLDPSFDAEAYNAARAERYARRENFY